MRPLLLNRDDIRPIWESHCVKVFSQLYYREPQPFPALPSRRAKPKAIKDAVR